MPQPTTLPRRPLSEPEDAYARRQINRWEETQPGNEDELEQATFNSSV